MRLFVMALTLLTFCNFTFASINTMKVRVSGVREVSEGQKQMSITKQWESLGVAVKQPREKILVSPLEIPSDIQWLARMPGRPLPRSPKPLKTNRPNITDILRRSHEGLPPSGHIISAGEIGTPKNQEGPLISVHSYDFPHPLTTIDFLPRSTNSQEGITNGSSPTPVTSKDSRSVLNYDIPQPPTTIEADLDEVRRMLNYDIPQPPTASKPEPPEEEGEDVECGKVQPGTYAGERKVWTSKEICYPFCWCPCSTSVFEMGSSDGELGQYDNEKQHKTTLSQGFWMLETEVTQEMWMSVMGSNPSKFKGDKKPVENVSWDECQEFCRKLSSELGLQVNLPTETQWEYACRAGTTDTYAGNLDKMGWYIKNSENTTHPVAQKEPNAWGFYDMHGNVWEWCSDRYDVDYDAKTPMSNPTGPESGSCRVCRGGSWNSCADFCRSAHRNCLSPGSKLSTLGFRFVLTVPASGK